MKLAIICGCGHSGTSLLVNMFAARSDTHVPLRETRLFFRRTAWIRLMKLRIEAFLKGKSLVVEKTPRHVEKLHRVREVAPGSKIILMVRDGRDVTASIFKRFSDEDQAVARWVSANEIVIAQEGMSDCAIVRYEDLITQPEEELRRLCEFIGIEFDPAMLDYHSEKRNWFGTKELKKGSDGDGAEHNNLRNWQINQPIFDGRGKWKEVFDAVPSALTTGRGAEIMSHFDYSTTADSSEQG